ncbi:MAG: DUF1553 domain-containing protein [Planctomycetaceae bacterium]|nr:DUF1553 domain-containing protein [Planctomycetaceae bacterium]
MSLIIRSLLIIAFVVSNARGADYLTEIKPLLEHKCYACHGALKQQGSLRVDTANSLLQGGDSGSLIEPGKPEESLLIDVLTGDAGFRMPPANEGAPLSPEEIDLIRDWIEAGAPPPEKESPQTDPRSWWSYQPIERPPLPTVQDRDWCRNEIDHFIAAAREQRNLPVVPEAEKAIWLRRVFLDLIGLPPSRDELHRFLADRSPDSYERVVDDLLSRPQYGERWGRHWMDVWRYSDWYGSRGINEIRYSQRHIWRWRDWIVRSLNEDKGYDRMVHEMLAADEICAGDPKTLPATGYLGRNWYLFDRNVWMFETVERTGEAFLGLTLRCCRCHDHKFDPITQQEYYEFRAFFEPHNVRTDPVSALTGTQKDAKAGQVLNDGIALVYDKELDVPTYRFQRGDSRYPDESEPLSPGVPAALGGEINIQPVDLPAATWYPLLREGVRETLVEKAAATVAAAEQRLKSAEEKLETVSNKLEAARRRDEQTNSTDSTVLLEDDFSQQRSDLWETLNGQWEWRDGKLVQSQVTSFATLVSKQMLPLDMDIHLKYRPLTPGTYRSIGFSFDYQDKGNSQDIYTSTGDERQSVQAFHRVKGRQTYPQAGIKMVPLKVGEEAVLDVSVTGSKLTIDLNGERRLDYTMPVARREGKFALWVHQGAAEFLELSIHKREESIESLASLQQQARQQVEIARAEVEWTQAAQNSVESRLAAELDRYLESEQAPGNQLAKEALTAELNAGVLKAKLEYLQAGESDEARQKAAKALAEAEQKLSAGEGTYSPLGDQYPQTSTGRRSALADWLTDRDNPRTARVAVNHLWGRHFGRPLVETPENFGLNGRQPSHPELLDWLAAELMENNWRMKDLHRQIVLSSTYRLSSRPFPVESSAARQVESDAENRFFWRMNSRRMEAELVRDSILALSGRLDLQQGGPEIPETEGETNLRRSLYFRNTPNEKMLMLEVFDVADPNGCYRRKESVVPHQSLALMNSGLAIDSARALAQQLGDAANFVTAAYETILGRAPTVREMDRCRTFLDEHEQLVNAQSPEQFSAGGTAQQAPSDDPKLRARENLVHVLFLHNDFVTIR